MNQADLPSLEDFYMTRLTPFIVFLFLMPVMGPVSASAMTCAEGAGFGPQLEEPNAVAHWAISGVVFAGCLSETTIPTIPLFSDVGFAESPVKIEWSAACRVAFRDQSNFYTYTVGSVSASVGGASYIGRTPVLLEGRPYIITSEMSVDIPEAVGPEYTINTIRDNPDDLYDDRPCVWNQDDSQVLAGDLEAQTKWSAAMVSANTWAAEYIDNAALGGRAEASFSFLDIGGGPLAAIGPFPSTTFTMKYEPNTGAWDWLGEFVVADLDVTEPGDHQLLIHGQGESSGNDREASDIVQYVARNVLET